MYSGMFVLYLNYMITLHCYTEHITFCLGYYNTRTGCLNRGKAPISYTTTFTRIMGYNLPAVTPVRNVVYNNAYDVVQTPFFPY